MFAGSWKNVRDANVLLASFPYDGGSLIKGSSKAPRFIRKYSYMIESYSVLFKKDVSSSYFVDLGDISFDNFDRIFSIKKSVFLGGDHSITPKLVERLKPDLLVHIDAHMDFKDVFGRKDSHACSMKRVAEIIGEDNIYHFGVRSWSEEESYREVYLRPISSLPYLSFKGKIYITLDLDIIDPSFMPGVNTPEPFGEIPKDVVKFLVEFILNNPNVQWVDVVEYNPIVEERVSGVLTASIVRELLLALGSIV